MSRYATPVSPAWSNTSLEFVGLPAAVGDEAFVSYYTADKKLYMGGFRAADGEQLMYPCHGDRTAATRASIGAVGPPVSGKINTSTARLRMTGSTRSAISAGSTP